MGKPAKAEVRGQEISGTELDFEIIKEAWNEYRCEDGSIIRLRTVVTQILRTEHKNPQTGEPVYVVKSANVIDVRPTQSEQGVS